MERPHLFTLGYNNKIAKVCSQHLQIFYSWTIGPDYNINVYDHNFAQMYSLCELVSQVSDAAHGPFVLFLFLFFSCGFVLFHYIFSRVWGKTPNKQTNKQTNIFLFFEIQSPLGPPFEAARNEVNILWNEMMNHLWNDLS